MNSQEGGTFVADRTPEQRTADDALTSAVEQAMTAEGWTDGLLTDYVVLAVRHCYDDDGGSTTQHVSLYRDGSMPSYRALGLVHATRLQLESDLASRD